MDSVEGSEEDLEREHEMPSIHLERNQVWSFWADRPLRIEAKSGILWVTQEGDNRDYIVDRHREFHSVMKGRVLAQALASTEMEWESLGLTASCLEANPGLEVLHLSTSVQAG